MELREILVEAVKKQASDIFFVVGRKISFKIKGVIEAYGEHILYKEDTITLIHDMYKLSDHRAMELCKEGDDDFALSIPDVGRFRVNVYRQRGTFSAVLRVVVFELPAFEQMGIPKQVINFSTYTKGLVLVTGTSGSGKSTTLSYLIDEINKNRNCHIITLEDPIEFLHKHKNSIVSQREIGIDSINYSKALRSAMRESPDVILIGEMRDLETIEIAMTAAETGHLVFSTLHTVGAANTIDRIIDVFPPNQQQQIRVQLGMVLKGIVSQQLLKSKESLIPAFEILMANNAVKNLIREGKIHQIDSVLSTSSKEGMVTMDQAILELYKNGKINQETALTYCTNQDTLRRNLSMN